MYTVNTSDSLKETNISFDEFCLNTKNFFKNSDKLRILGISDMREFSKRIQKEFENVESVIKNIVLYGSGKDSVFRHSVNVAALSNILGKWIGLDKDQLNLLSYSAIFHDFGKTKIDEKILNKTCVLTKHEFKLIHSHPITGYNFTKKIPYLDSSVSYGVLMHHERLDGSGYPLGLKGKNIHLFAKIIAIADSFDAINSNRPHRKKKKPFEALQVIKEDSLARLDFEYCNIFINHIVNYYLGENILLNNHKIGKIIQIDPHDLQRPLILVDSDFINLKKYPNLFIEKFVF